MVGLPSDLQYCLDSMMELHEMTGDVYEYFFSVKKNAVQFLDDGISNERLFEDYNEWRSTASKTEKALLTLSGIDSLSMQMSDYILAVTNDSITAAKKKPAKSVITKYMSIGTTQERFNKNFNRLYNQAKIDFSNVDVKAILNYQKKLKLERRAFYELNHPWDTVDRICKQIKLKPNKTRIKKNRKVLIKSVNLMSNFFTPEETKLFLGRESVTITGDKFNFEINAKDFNILSHGALKIRVMNKQSEHLSNLCFYYENMPAADQITAFLLDIQAGNEEKIMEIGNLYLMTEIGVNDSNLKKYLPTSIPNYDDIGNHLENLFPGHSIVKKYHDEVKPIVKEMLKKKLNTKLLEFNRLLTNFKSDQLLLR